MISEQHAMQKKKTFAWPIDISVKDTHGSQRQF